jgi:hypothetical protein
VITLDEAKEALLRSGYLLESRIETIFRRKAYYVQSNSVYPDPRTGTSRELDVYALGAIKAGPGEQDYLFTAFLTECINNPEPLVLITKDPQAGFLHIEDLKFSGIPVRFPTKKRPNEWIRFTEYLDVEKYHHYCRGRVATQFCSFQKKRQQPHDWMAWHDETHFDAFRKLSAAVDHAVADHYRRWTFDGEEPINIQLYYPVLVVQGELLEARSTRGTVRLSRRSHIAFRRSEFVEGEERSYQIDVLQERHFPRFVALAERESERMARLLQRRQRQVRDAIDRIVRGARRFKSPERIRKAMER